MPTIVCVVLQLKVLVENGRERDIEGGTERWVEREWLETERMVRERWREREIYKEVVEFKLKITSKSSERSTYVIGSGCDLQK